MCVSGSACEQNSSRTDEPIWTRFSLNGCLTHWLEPYWNWWPWVKGQGHSDVIRIFSSLFSVNFPTLYLSSLMFDQNEIRCIAKIYSLGRLDLLVVSWWIQCLHSSSPAYTILGESLHGPPYYDLSLSFLLYTFFSRLSLAFQLSSSPGRFVFEFHKNSNGDDVIVT